MIRLLYWFRKRFYYKDINDVQLVFASDFNIMYYYPQNVSWDFRFRKFYWYLHFINWTFNIIKQNDIRALVIITSRKNKPAPLWFQAISGNGSNTLLPRLRPGPADRNSRGKMATCVFRFPRIWMRFLSLGKYMTCTRSDWNLAGLVENEPDLELYFDSVRLGRMQWQSCEIGKSCSCNSEYSSKRQWMFKLPKSANQTLIKGSVLPWRYIRIDSFAEHIS